MSEIRTRINTLKMNFTRIRRNRNEYRKRSEIYKSQMIDLKIDKKKLKKKLQKLFENNQFKHYNRDII